MADFHLDLPRVSSNIIPINPEVLHTPAGDYTVMISQKSGTLPSVQKQCMISAVVAGHITECMISAAQSGNTSTRIGAKSPDGKSYTENARFQGDRHTLEIAPVVEQLQSWIDSVASTDRILFEQAEILGNVRRRANIDYLSPLVRLTSQTDFDSFGSSDTPAVKNDNCDSDVPASNKDNRSPQKASSSPPTGTPEDGCSSSSDDAEGVIYTRVSSEKQVQQGNSIADQKTRLKKLAVNRGISLVCPPIEDSAESGTDFDRPGISKVTRLARKGEFSYLLVDDIDRIGRNAPESLHYIYQLRQSGITIVTPSDGELDVDDITGLAVTFVKTFCSQLENETRARRVNRARVEKYKQGDWSAAFKRIPFGYEEKGDWIAVNPTEADVLHGAINFFLETDIEGAYKKTVDAAKLEQYDVSTRRLKALLQKPVLHGKPTYRRDSGDLEDDLSEPVVVKDPSLEIISKRQFDRVQEKIDKIYDRYAKGKSKSTEIDDYVDRFGLDAVVDAAQCVELRCPVPGCHSELVKNGQRTTNGEPVHNYICGQGHQRKFPKQRDLNRMHDLSEVEDETGGEEQEDD